MPPAVFPLRAVVWAACLGGLLVATPVPASATPRAVVADTTQPHPLSDGGTVRLGQPLRSRLLAEDPLWTRALALHYDAIVLDGHIDTPTLMLEDGYDFRRRNQARVSSAHLDLPRMFEGGLDGGFFALYVRAGFGEGEAATQQARDMLAELQRQVALAPDSAAFARTAADVERLARSGKKAILLGLEGGHALQGSPAILREFADAGVRYVTLTHVNTNAWADASQSAPRWGGLNALGRDLVREMNRLGVLVDVSHVADSTFYDALAVSRAPVICSHSSVRALTGTVRNVTDDMLRALAAQGGVLMINFFDYTVNRALTPDVMAAAYARVRTEYGGNLRMMWTAIAVEADARGLPHSTWQDVVAHIDYAVQIAGVDHVGLGSDFDGVFRLPDGLGDVTRLPFVTYGLLQKGYSEDDIRKILGGNTLRVLREAERVAAEMQR